MHIPDGVVSLPVLAGASLVAGSLVAVGLKKMTNEDIPKTAVLTAGFFIASLIHIPVPPGSVHLLLPGLMGILLGWNVVPAVFTGLLMQYLMFGHGGLTTLGVNTVIFAVPGLSCHYIFSRFSGGSQRAAFNYGLLAGITGVAFSCLLFAGALYLGGKEFATIAGFCLYSHLPIVLIEGMVTGSALMFIYRVRPRSLPHYRPEREPMAEGVVQ